MAKRSKKQRAADRFLDILQQRQDEFAVIEDDRALAIRRSLQRTRRRARQLIGEHQKQFARKGHYLTGVASLKQAQQTAQDIDSLMARDFTRTSDRLISLKQEAFEKGVWDFDVASQKLPKNLRGRIGGTFSQVMPEAAYAAAEHPVMGISPEMTFNGIRAGTEQRVRSVMTEAVLSGASIQDVTATLDQALNVSVDAAERLARTSLNAAYNDAHKMIYDANADIFAGYRWDAIMDDRVSATCIMLHGQFWPLGSMPPGPPAHWNCRSILTPVFRDPALNSMMMEDTVRVRNYTADGKEKYGWIKNKTSSQDWLRKQPTAVTRGITGSRVKNQLFRSGKIDMDDIVGPDLITRTDKAVLRRAWANNPTDKAVVEMAHANGVHRAPKWDTILKEDAALARKQPYDMPVSLEQAEAGPAAPAVRPVSPERLAKWQDDLATTNEDMELAQLSIKQLRADLRTAPRDLKATYTRQINQATADYARLRNKKWRINKRIKQGGGPGPEPPPRPVVSTKIAKLESAWQETVDELAGTREKLAAARKANKTERIAVLRKDEARLINKRWRRWKRLPPDSQTRLKTGVKPKPPKPPAPPRQSYVDRGSSKTHQRSQKKWLDSLTKEEEAVLQDWQEVRPVMDRIRQREAGIISGKRATDEMRIFNQALDRAPARGGTVFRGLALDDKDFQKFIRDKTLHFKASGSSSRMEDIALEFATEASKKTRPNKVVLELKTYSSIDVSQIAPSPVLQEAEQTIRKGTKFRITGIKRRGDVTHIFGEEIQARPRLRLPTPLKKVTSRQKFDTGVAGVEKTNKRIVELRTKASPSLGETQELKVLQAARTREMNKLRALRRTNKDLPELPESTRLPKVTKAAPKPKPVGQVKPEDIQVQFSPKVQKLRQKMDDLEAQWSKVAEELKPLSKKDSALFRQRSVLRRAGQRGTPEYEAVQAARVKNNAAIDIVKRRAGDLRTRVNAARAQFNRAAAVERAEVLAKIRKPKFITKADDAIARAKAELDALGYDLATLKHSSMDPTELLDLLNAVHGQGANINLTPIRQAIWDNARKELEALGQWSTKAGQQWKQMLGSIDESLLQSNQLEGVLFQWSADSRAFANRWMNTIGITKREQFKTMAHEVGHHLQYRNPKLRGRTVRWQRGRTEDDLLTTIYKGTKERGKRDKFYTHYVGKVYTDGFQEGVSMGVQTFFDKGMSWRSIMKTDPDHMYLTWAMLRGF